MSRPLRIEFAGALYHITSRGNERQAIYRQDADRQLFFEVLEEVCRRYHWLIHGYCQMDNHYHVLVETPDGHLSRGMRQLNGVYTQGFNRLHNRVGHVFQGRYKAILVDKDSYLLELSRYIVLNPVRARMVRSAEEWPWSSYRATAGLCAAPAWLYTDWLLGLFSNDGNKKAACERYSQFVAQGKNQPGPWEHLKNQVYLGSEAFVEAMQCQLSPDAKLQDVPAIQKRQVRQPLAYYAAKYSDRNVAIENEKARGHEKARGQVLQNHILNLLFLLWHCHYVRISRRNGF